MIELRTITELEELIEWRKEVIRTVFEVEPSEALLEANASYYLKHVADGTHLAVVVSVDGEEAGCGSICFTDELPSPDNPSGQCAYLMNIYVRPRFRKHGLAHHLVKALVEEAKLRNCDKIYLEATDDGKPVYLSEGFRDMPDMMKYYENGN